MDIFVGRLIQNLVDGKFLRERERVGQFVLQVSKVKIFLTL